MIIEQFSRLPPWVSHEGANFELRLIHNGRADDIRLVYAFSYVDSVSPHRETYQEHNAWLNPFADGKMQGFLYLCENIETDEDLLEAIGWAIVFLQKNNLWR